MPKEHDKPETNTETGGRLEQLVSFSKDDVLVVAKALIENHSIFVSGDYSSDHYICEHCEGKSKSFAGSEAEIVHELNCPVLIAQDLLVGS
jgi:hypothetical protein